MPTFVAKARNWDGKIVTQEMEGESKEVCISKLREKGYFVTSITEKKGGSDSLYCIDYAARMAAELGADEVKINLPKQGTPDSPKPYNTLQMDELEMAKKVVKSAGKCMVLFSGGSKLSGGTDSRLRASATM